MRRKTRLSKSARSRKISRLVRQNPFGDYDGDGVQNIYDCEPTDPKKHGVEPSATTWERLKALPIYVSDSTSRKEKYHISDSRAKDFAPDARSRFLSVLKHYPQILNSIEHSGVEQVIFTTAVISLTGVLPPAKSRLRKEVLGLTAPTEYDEKLSTVVVSLTDRPFAKKPYTKFGPSGIERSASAVFHELEHVRQHLAWKTASSKLARRMEKGAYWVRPSEVKARTVAEKKLTAADLPVARILRKRGTGEPAFPAGEKKLWQRAEKVLSGKIGD